MQSRFGKACLVLILFLLLVIASRPLFQPQPTHAAEPVQYKVIPIPHQDMLGDAIKIQELLNQRGKEGWHLVLIQDCMTVGLAVLSK